MPLGRRGQPLSVDEKASLLRGGVFYRAASVQVPQLRFLAETIIWLCSKWDGMRAKVHNPVYFKRGIKICDQWLGRSGRANFIVWALQSGCDPHLDIDRID